ncbi:TPA: hypothetical protein ACUB6Y_002838 [Raoultella ornithinolytica]|uniref:hypothetical protein n=1 Tax=Klebsiella variicola TaxID=244366 RepID=UPI002B057063|nr:hypothetical protein [Klebsiella variicola]
MKLQLIGKGNLPLLQWILDGKNDDAIINMSALARRIECSRSSLLDRIHTHGFDSAVRYYLSEQRQRKLKT